MKRTKNISRREALARLGLGAAGLYMTPNIVGLSMARASTVSTVSVVTPPTVPTAATAPTVPSVVTEPTVPSEPSSSETSADGYLSGPSGPGTCQLSTMQNGAQISRRDYQQAQRAILRGDARPLREVLDGIQSQYPGKLLQVGFSESGTEPAFKVLIAGPSGAVMSVTVAAATGLVIGVRKC